MAESFDFRGWYDGMGYRRHGGRTDCAEVLGVTTSHVRYLDEGEREPSKTLVKLCRALERERKRAAQPQRIFVRA